MLRVFFVLCLLSFVKPIAKAQIADCVGAYPVCGNGEIGFQPNGIGADDFATAGNNPPSCGFDESQSLWLRFKIKEAGTLGFDLIPEDLTGDDRDDYDFALYGPNVDCSSLGSDIRCSSTNPQQANVQAETGMNETESDISEGPGTAGNGYIHWLDNVQVGDVYYLLIDNFDQDQGFTLQWTGTALLEDRITKEEGGVDLGDDLFICGQSSAELDATTIGGSTYLWNTGATTPIITVTEPGNYSVQVTTESGCYSEDEIEVMIAPNPEITLATATLDTNCEPAEVLLQAEGSSGTFQWISPDGEVVADAASITLSEQQSENTGQYTVVLTNEFGCTDETTVSVNIYPNYLFEEEIRPCPGDQFVIPQTGQIITESDSVEVNLTTEQGCDSTYVYNIQFYTCGDQNCTGFPTAISPNEDGVNDQLKPLFSATCFPLDFTLIVFNRWGEKVFETTDYTKGWNGFIKEKVAQPGLYLWMMDYTMNNNQTFSYSGGIHVIH